MLLGIDRAAAVSLLRIWRAVSFEAGAYLPYDFPVIRLSRRPGASWHSAAWIHFRNCGTSQIPRAHVARLENAGALEPSLVSPNFTHYEVTRRGMGLDLLGLEDLGPALEKTLFQLRCAIGYDRRRFTFRSPLILEGKEGRLHVIPGRPALIKGLEISLEDLAALAGRGLVEGYGDRTHRLTHKATAYLSGRSAG